jgi:hypothetical protein
MRPAAVEKPGRGYRLPVEESLMLKERLALQFTSAEQNQTITMTRNVQTKKRVGTFGNSHPLFQHGTIN